MNVQQGLLIIILMASLLKLGYGSDGESCFKESREQDEMCGKYCYKVVKPLLSYAAIVRTKEEQFGELQNTIKDQEVTIIKLQHQLETAFKQNNDQGATITKLQQQCASMDAKFGDSTKIHDQVETILETIIKLQQQCASKDEHITKHMSDNNANVKEMNELKLQYSQFQSSSISSNCLGQSTGLNTLSLPNIGTFSALCDSKLADPGWTVVQRRIDGSVNFSRDWDEYKAGFGDLRGEFFLGLEKLHLLTQFEPHELYIHLQDFDNNTAYARYSHFLIGNETESFELKMLGDYSGTAGDSLNYHRTMKFSTKDRDNDKSDINCAKHLNSAWWYHKCSFSDLNGPQSNSGIGTSRIVWGTWHDNAIKIVQMMIRPKSH